MLYQHLATFEYCLLVDAFTEAKPIHWLRRAREFEAARHRPGVDHPGRASLDELRARWVQTTRVAQACRNRAQVGIDRGDAVAVAALVLDEREVA